jgi:hypothetical protein
MLDPWVIEEILRREREENRYEELRIELPLMPPPSVERTAPAEEPRGVIVIDI